MFERAQREIGLVEIFVLYQLRHGGPSHDRAFHSRSMMEIKARGQWLSDLSVRRYEGHARLQQVEARVPEGLRKLLMGAPDRLRLALQSHISSMAGPLCRLGGMNGVVLKSSAAAPLSRKRLRDKGSAWKPGTRPTPPPTTSCCQPSLPTSSTFCERASPSSSTLACRARRGVEREGLMAEARVR